jgi:hypothetical protein
MSDELDGCLDPRNKPLLADHLAACAGCRQEFDELRQTVTLLRQMEPVVPPGGMVSAVRQSLQRKSRASVWSVLSLPQTRVAIAAGLVLIVGVYGWREMTVPRLVEVSREGGGAAADRSGSRQEKEAARLSAHLTGKVEAAEKVTTESEDCSAELRSDKSESLTIAASRQDAPRPAPPAGPSRQPGEVFGREVAKDVAAVEELAETMPAPVAAPPAIAAQPVRPADAGKAPQAGIANRESLAKRKDGSASSVRRGKAEADGVIWSGDAKEIHLVAQAQPAEAQASVNEALAKQDDSDAAVVASRRVSADKLSQAAAIATGDLPGDVAAGVWAAGEGLGYATAKGGPGRAAESIAMTDSYSENSARPAAAPAPVTAAKAVGAREQKAAAASDAILAETVPAETAGAASLAITVATKDAGAVLALVEKYTEQADLKDASRKAAVGSSLAKSARTRTDSGPVTLAARISAAAYPEFLRLMKTVGTLTVPAQPARDEGAVSAGKDDGLILLKITIVPESAAHGR